MQASPASPVFDALDAAIASREPGDGLFIERLTQLALAEASDTPAGGDAGRELGQWLSRRSGMPLSSLASWATERADTQLIPFADGLRRACLAQRHDDGTRDIVLADPFSDATRWWVEQRLRQAGEPAARWHVATLPEVQAYYARLERELKALDTPVNAGSQAAPDLSADALALSLASISEDESPVVRFVNSTLYDALKAQASDIHLETFAQGLTVKYRLDGVLNTVTRIDGRELADRVLSRLKVLADLDISERRVPQDGRLKLRLGEREIDVRVSIMPSLFGEDAVLRILDRYQLAANEQLSIGHLSFDETSAAFIRKMSTLPHGLFLVTGPTGSGKTTTLYGLLSEINTGLDKIITIEDPVEYQVGGVLQIPVNEAKGLTFAKGLRSILRHDPDKIMVGEIRDAETAQIAIQAALTGHQVFATVHANNVFDVIGRMSAMGVDLYNMVAALNGVLAQRLLRVNCPQCSVAFEADHAWLEQTGLDRVGIPLRLRKGTGCAHCRGTGYKGRRAIAQTMTMDTGLRTLISSRAGFDQLRSAAIERGLTTLRDSALQLVARGHTTWEEASRVTAAEE
jgi:general secretion pathway protein E